MSKQKNHGDSTFGKLRESQFKEEYWRDAKEEDCDKLMMARFRDNPSDVWHHGVLFTHEYIGRKMWVDEAEPGQGCGWAICQVYDPPKKKPQARQVVGRAIAAQGWMLMEFTHDELKHYANTLNVPIGKTKFSTIRALLQKGAKVRMTLGK